MMEEEQPFLQSKAMIKGGFMPRLRLRWAHRIMQALRRSFFMRHRRPSFRLAVCMRKAAHCFTRKAHGKPHPGPHIHPIYFRLQHVKRNHGGSPFHAHHHVNTPFTPPHFRHPYTHLHYGGSTGHDDDDDDHVDDDYDDDDDNISDSMALLHLREHAPSHRHPLYYNDGGHFMPLATHTPLRMHPPLRRRVQFTSEPLAFQHLAHSDDAHFKRRARRWQCRVNRALHSLSHHKQGVPHDVPKGCVGVYVGAEQRRFIVPILHLNHPLFAHLLECMHEDHGFSRPGPLYIPCDVSEFESLHSQVKQMSKRL